MQQFVDGQDGIVLDIAGMHGRNLFIPNEHQRIRCMDCQAGVEDFCQLLSLELGQSRTADLCAVQKSLVGRGADGIQIISHTKSQTQIFDRVGQCFLAGAMHECSDIAVQCRRCVQRFDVQVTDLAAAPQAFLCQILMMPEHLGIGLEGGRVVVLTG